MYHVSAQGVDEHIINGHYYYYYYKMPVSKYAQTVSHKMLVSKYAQTMSHKMPVSEYLSPADSQSQSTKLNT